METVLTKGVILVSGGLDSTTLMYQFVAQNVEFVPLFINYGQHCASKEYDTLLKVIPEKYKDKIETIDISSIFKYSKSKFIRPVDLWKDDIKAEDLYIPYRNVLLMTVAASFAQTLGLNKVYAAFINSNHAKEIDCSMEFFTKLESLLYEYGSIRINMPFREMTKTEVAKLGLELKAPIEMTYSCQVNADMPCGACPNCVDRINAINNILEEKING